MVTMTIEKWPPWEEQRIVMLFDLSSSSSRSHVVGTAADDIFRLPTPGSCKTMVRGVVQYKPRSQFSSNVQA